MWNFCTILSAFISINPYFFFGNSGLPPRIFPLLLHTTSSLTTSLVGANASAPHKLDFCTVTISLWWRVSLYFQYLTSFTAGVDLFFNFFSFQCNNSFRPRFHWAVQFGRVQYIKQIFAFRWSKVGNSTQITDPYHPTFWHPFVRVPNTLTRSQAVRRGWSYTRCSPLNASRQNPVFKCRHRTVDVSLQ